MCLTSFHFLVYLSESQHFVLLWLLSPSYFSFLKKTKTLKDRKGNVFPEFDGRGMLHGAL